MKTTALKVTENQELFPQANKMAMNSPAEMMIQALSNGATPETIEKMLELQERWEATQAKKAYHHAMTAFKANPPLIEKDRKVSFGNTKYSHASLANVTQKINEELSKHGLSASWKVSQNGNIAVTCKITHEQGHSEETTISAPADTSGSKNAIQSIGSAISYLQRYSLLAATGLATQDIFDDDGMSVTTEKITPEEAKSILDQLTQIGASMEKFLSYMGITKVEDMSKSELNRALVAIDSIKKKKQNG